jgi:hypothetical protein
MPKENTVPANYRSSTLAILFLLLVMWSGGAYRRVTIKGYAYSEEKAKYRFSNKSKTYTMAIRDTTPGTPPDRYKEPRDNTYSLRHVPRTFYGKGPHRLLRAGSRDVRGKITVSDLPNRLNHCKKKKGKAVPFQAWTGPEGSRRLRLPDF